MSAAHRADRVDWREKLELIRNELQAKGKALQGAFKLKEWRTTTGERTPEQALDEHANWPEHSLVYAWSPRDGDRMFFNRVSVPAMVMGIPLLSSQIGLELWLNIGAAVYVNGEAVYQVDYWADTQVVPIELTKSAGGNDTFDLFIQCKQGDGFGYFQMADIRIDALDEWIFQLDTLEEELGFVRFLIENGDISEEVIAGTLHEALEAFDHDALINNRWEAVEANIKELRFRLSFLRPYAKSYKVHLVAHAHIDMNWLWPWSETESLIVRDFEAMLGIMEEFPQVCFSHSQAATYRLVQSRYPKLWERVKRQVERGVWDVTASTWVEGDLNLSGYESLVRQFLLGKSYAREQLGVDPIVCWEPDTFGHPATMPQVLAGAGIKYYYHSRAGRGIPVYWWEGAEGSHILVYNEPSPTGYMGRIFATRIVPGLTALARSYGLKTDMYVYGIGDHGGGATRQDVLRAIRLNESPLLPRFEFSRTVDFYEELERFGSRFPVIRGELNPIFTGCYSSHGDIKRANRRTEHALVQAETLSSIADIRHWSLRKSPEVGAGGDRIGEQLAEAWQRQCFNQFHDILCGCSIRSTYDEAVPAAEQAEKTAELVSRKMMRRINEASAESPSAKKNREQTHETLVVFNTLSWHRTDAVVLRREDYPDAEHWKDGDWLEDEAGKRADLQCTGGEIVFVAKGIPPHGYKAYRYYRASEAPKTNPDWSILLSPFGNPILDIGRYRTEIDHESGTIIDLKDKESGKRYSYPHEWSDRSPKGKLNLLEVQYEAPHAMSAWIIGTISGTRRLVEGADVRMLHQGPVFQAVEIKHRFNESEICQQIRVYRELNRIDFPTVVDWREQGSGTREAPMLRVSFTPCIKAAEHTSHIPFGTIERPADGTEIPALHWIDVSESAGDEGYGMTLLNTAKYGHSIQGNTMTMTLIRSSYEPDNSGDVGRHEFTYSVYPHSGNWRKSHSDRRGWEINQPLKAILLHSNECVRADCFSALQVEELTADGWREATGTIVSAFKPSERVGGGNVKTVRLVQMHGNAVQIRIRAAMPMRAVEEVDLLEEPIRTIVNAEGSLMEIGGIKEGEIRTIRLHFNTHE
ncbi:alpha-mannosidase [Cohnella phaseoli]|uniref:Alpha-mannosidase n=1 Tax=Cohnella phaseoli TaxID=456490 RepID=A0A3D9KG94_9BACL|nr:alpha-mannosidase [Cohnella phaseoli]RED85485.1 alpha-mannosidase [Cohnella phaseoli]